MSASTVTAHVSGCRVGGAGTAQSKAVRSPGYAGGAAFQEHPPNGTGRAELVRLVLLPEGVCYDLVRKQLVAVRPRASCFAPLRLAWHDWQAQDDGWLVRDAEPAVVPLLRRAGGAPSSA